MIKTRAKDTYHHVQIIEAGKVFFAFENLRGTVVTKLSIRHLIGELR